MLQLPPHGFNPPSAQLWKNKLLILAMGLSAVLLLADRSQALAAARAAQGTTPNRRPSGQPEPPATVPATVPTLWVNPQTGNDAKADGSEQAPFRSLTRALQVAPARSVIQLAAGTYSINSGEQFPILLKPDVTVQGNSDDLGQAVVIQGGGSYSSQSAGRQTVTLVGVNRAVLTGVTVTNPAVQGYGFWVETGSPMIQSNTFTGSNTGLIAVGSSSPVIQNNLFMLNRSGLQILGESRPQVSANIFQRTGTGITIGETAAGQIVGNRISQNRDGIVVRDKAQPLLRRNQIEDSERDGIVVMAQAQPDLGSRRDPGQNQFLNSQQHDVNAATAQTLSAVGNQITGQLAGNLDLTGQNSLSAQAPQTALIASLPPAASTAVSTAANKVLAPVRSAAAIQPAQPARSIMAFNPPASASSPITISVPPPERVMALATGLQPASSARPITRPHQPFNQPAPIPNPIAPTAAPAQTAPDPTPPLGNVIVTAAASLPRQNFAALSAPTLSGSPINHPAPPAERRANSQSNSPSRQPNRPQAANSLLLVPAGEIPVGNTGDMTRVSLGQAVSRAFQGVPGSLPQSSQYRVLVADTDSQVQSRVQALVPDAFSTSIRGQSALQIGAFSSYENAQDAVQLLSQNGLQGIIQPVE